MKKLAKEVIMLGLVVIIITLIATFIFQTQLGSSLMQSSIVDSLYTKILPALFEVLLLFIFFKLLFYVVVSFFYDALIQKFVSNQRYMRTRKLLVFGWWAVFGVFSLFIVVEDAATLIASAGLVGLGLTFALQKPIMNFVGWLTIVFQNVYSEGDRIKIGEVRGDVIEIQIMNTVLNGLLETGDLPSHKVVTIPNELVLITDVENYTKDSNYVLEELTISVTYESDYKKALKVLERVIQKTIAKNLRAYIKKKEQEKLRINKLLDTFVHKSGRSKLEKEGDDIETELEKLSKLSEEFKPKIRLEMADSSIELVARFLTPYDQIKRARSLINVGFLDAIKEHDDIEVAYPHVQLVLDDSSKDALSRARKRK